jgi:exocyst complex component 8
LECLSLPSNKKTSISNLVSLLIRLNAGAAARNTLLEMRGKVIHSLMRKIPFEGHVATYIGALTVVFFMGIKNTADWYLFAFKENDAASGRSMGSLHAELC